MKALQGFNLLELMITLAIVSMLIAMAIPIYSQHFVYANRLQAELDLQRLATALENYYLFNHTYADVDMKKLNIGKSSAHGNYYLAIVNSTPNTYTLIAEPQLAQAKRDTQCAALILNSRGEKNSTGTSKDCW